MSEEEFDELEAAATPSFGHCNEMGTASTMAALVEALGMSPARDGDDPRRRRGPLRAPPRRPGARAVELAREGLRPSQILTAEAFDNAITLLMAIGGGTNAVIHLLALAGRVGVPLTLDRFDELSRRRRCIANLRPSGEHLVRGPAPRRRRAGACCASSRRCSHGDALTSPGATLGERLRERRERSTAT